MNFILHPERDRLFLMLHRYSRVCPDCGKQRVYSAPVGRLVSGALLTCDCGSYPASAGHGMLAARARVDTQLGHLP